MATSDDNSNGIGLLTIGNLISIFVAAGMVVAAYVSISKDVAENRRATDDLYKLVYDLKKDTKEWQTGETEYDAKMRDRIEQRESKVSDILSELKSEIAAIVDGSRRNGHPQ